MFKNSGSELSAVLENIVPMENQFKKYLRVLEAEAKCHLQL